MTTKAKTREAPMSGAVAQAIARHKAAQAAIAAVADDPNGCPQHLKEAEFDAIDELALAPCASDVEFKEKLRYLRSGSRLALSHGDHVTLRLRYRIWKLRALIWVLRRRRAVEYRSNIERKAQN